MTSINSSNTNPAERAKVPALVARNCEQSTREGYTATAPGSALECIHEAGPEIRRGRPQKRIYFWRRRPVSSSTPPLRSVRAPAMDPGSISGAETGCPAQAGAPSDATRTASPQALRASRTQSHKNVFDIKSPPLQIERTREHPQRRTLRASVGPPHTAYRLRMDQGGPTPLGLGKPGHVTRKVLAGSRKKAWEDSSTGHRSTGKIRMRLRGRGFHRMDRSTGVAQSVCS